MKILITYASAGAGHRMAAEALYSGLKLLGETEVEKIDVLDYTGRVFRRAYPAVYILLVRKFPFLWGVFFKMMNSRRLAFFVRPLRIIMNRWNGRRLEEYILRTKPDVLLNAHFFSAEIGARLRREGRYQGRSVCVVTDFGVHRFWVNEGTDYYLGASDYTQQELLRLGVTPEKIKVFGIPVSPDFGHLPGQAEIRKRLNLSPDKFTVLITSGGFAVGPITEVADKLDKIDLSLQVLVVCGKNKELYALLQKRGYGSNIRLYGYVDKMSDFMAGADLIVSKSGGLTVSESLAAGLPLFVISPIPGQEKENIDFLEKNGAGLRIENVNEVPVKIRKLLQEGSGDLFRMKQAARQLAHPESATNIAKWIKTLNS